MCVWKFVCQVGERDVSDKVACERTVCSSLCQRVVCVCVCCVYESAVCGSVCVCSSLCVKELRLNELKRDMSVQGSV